MKWNTMYHLYEGLALLVIGLSWTLVGFTSSKVNSTHWQSFQYDLEASLIDAITVAKDREINLYKDVSKQGNPTEGLERIKRVKELTTVTDKLMIKLEEAKTALQQLDPDEYTITYDLMVRMRVACKIKNELDDYVKWLNAEFKDLELPKFEPLAQGNKKNPLYYTIQPDRDFAHNYFSSTSASEALAFITQKQLLVKRYEMEVLKKLSPAYDAVFLGYCNTVQVILMSKNKEVVQAGEMYTADMFIGLYPSFANPQMKINGELWQGYERQVKVEFTTQEAGKQFWEGEITYKHKGKYQTVKHKVPYEVLPK